MPRDYKYELQRAMCPALLPRWRKVLRTLKWPLIRILDGAGWWMLIETDWRVYAGWRGTYDRRRR